MTDHDTPLAGTWTALVTPFTPDGAAVDEERLVRAVLEQSVAGVTGIVACGTTGETPTLDADESRLVRERTTRAARDAGLGVVLGAGSNDTRHAIALHREAADLGADAALHVTPYYNKPNQDGLRRHYEAIAESADLPIILYDVPGRTGVRLELETIAALAADPRVVALKDAGGSLDRAEDVLARTDLTVLSGDDPMTLPMMALGAHGVVSVISNVYPGRIAAMVRAAADGRGEEALALHRALRPLAKALLSLGPNPVPVKTALALLERDSGAVRSPLVPLAPEARAIIADLVSAVELSPAADPESVRMA